MDPEITSKKIDSPNDSGTVIDALRLDIRQIAHDISNPLGTLRMAVYYLETVKPDESKQGEYLTMMTNNIDRIEGMVRRLRVLAAPPSVEREDQPDVAR